MFSRLIGEPSPASETRRAQRSRRKALACKKIPKSRVGLLFVLPSLAGLAVFTVWPFFDVVARSFQNNATTQWVAVSNYASVLSNEAFLLAAGNTAKFLFIGAPLLVLSSFFAALLISRIAAFQSLAKSGLLLPLAIPVGTTALLISLFLDTGGLVNGLLTRFGFQPHDWLGSASSFAILIICYLWRNVGFCTVLWLASFSKIPQSIIDASRVDGVSAFQLYTRIVIPLLRQAFFVVIIISIFNGFKVYREAYLLAGSYPTDSIYMLQHLINNWFVHLSISNIAVAAVVISIALSLLVLVLYRLLGRDTEESQ